MKYGFNYPGGVSLPIKRNNGQYFGPSFWLTIPAPKSRGRFSSLSHNVHVSLESVREEQEENYIKRCFFHYVTKNKFIVKKFQESTSVSQNLLSKTTRDEGRRKVRRKLS